ncbi:MAG: hypothetical protein QXG98_04275 [Candidatus Micrarchaeia archaeon]
MSQINDRKLRAKAKRLERALAEMRGCVVIVEGARDKAALEQMVAARFVLCNRSADEIAARLEGEEKAVILTDFDRRGEEKARALEAALEAHGVRADLEVRRALRYALGITFVEDAARRLAELMRECAEKKIELNIRVM